MGGRVVLVCALMLVPMAQAETGFAFWRDEAIPEYVINIEGTVAYSDGSWGSGSAYTNGGREWAFRLVDWPADLITMEAGTIDATVHVGGGTAEAGRAAVGWQLLHGGDVVASGETQTINYAGSLQELSWSVAAPEGEYVAGDLVFRVYTSGHIGVGARMNLGASSLSMPVTVPEPPVAGPAAVFENLTGLPLSIERSFANATTATHTYNWTHDGGAVDVTISGAVRNGTAVLRLVDPSGEEALAGELTDILAANQTVQVEAANGTWQIVLEMQDFVGDVALRLEAPPIIRGAPTDTNATGNVTLDEVVNEKSPAWAVVPALATLVLLARRRQR